MNFETRSLWRPILFFIILDIEYWFHIIIECQGIWKSDSSQKNKGKALTGWKIAEFACFFVSDLLLFTACKPQLSIEWQVSKSGKYLLAYCDRAINQHADLILTPLTSRKKKFCILRWRWPPDRMPITFVYAQWSIILASHANPTISLWSNAFLYSWLIIIIIINRCKVIKLVSQKVLIVWKFHISMFSSGTLATFALF